MTTAVTLTHKNASFHSNTQHTHNASFHFNKHARTPRVISTNTHVYTHTRTRTHTRTNASFHLQMTHAQIHTHTDASFHFQHTHTHLVEILQNRGVPVRHHHRGRSSLVGDDSRHAHAGAQFQNSSRVLVDADEKSQIYTWVWKFSF